MKISLFATLLLFGAATLHAQVKTEPSSSDPFDLSKSEQKVKELGIPTISSVAELERKAALLYQQKDWKAAAEANAEFSKAANWLANIIQAGLQPFYGASYDSRKSFKGTAELIGYEKQMNDLRQKRNRAMVIQAECEINAGNKDKGFGLLLAVLDLINIEDTEYWTKARVMLYQMIEVK